MSIAEKLVKVAENELKVYEAGKRDHWDVIQNYGNRQTYQYAFIEWGDEYIRPKYKIEPVTGHYAQLFHNNKKLKKVESEYFDLSKIQMTDSQKKSQTYGNYYTFQFCSELEEIEDIGLNDVGYSNTFHGCLKLHTIAMLRCNENTLFGSSSGMFLDCNSLVHLRFSDNSVINNTISFQWCPLSIESMINIISHLKNNSGTDKEFKNTITFSGTCLTALDALGNASPNGNSWRDYAFDLGWNIS